MQRGKGHARPVRLWRSKNGGLFFFGRFFCARLNGLQIVILLITVHFLLLIPLLGVSHQPVKVQICQIFIQLCQIAAGVLINDLPVYLIHQPKSNKVGKDFYRMRTVRGGAVCQIHMAQIRIIRLLIERFHTVRIDELPGFCQLAVIFPLFLLFTRKFLQFFDEQLQFRRQIFLRIDMVQKRVHILQKLPVPYGIAQTAFQFSLDFFLCTTHAHNFPAAVKFPIKVHDFFCKGVERIRLFFFGGDFLFIRLGQGSLRLRYFAGSDKRPRRFHFPKQGKSTVTECAKVFKSPFAPLVVTVILGCQFPHGEHHLIDFLNLRRIVKLGFDHLNCIIEVEAVRVRPRLFLRHTGKECLNIPRKLVPFIGGHSGAIFLRDKSAGSNQFTDTLFYLVPAQFHLGIRLGDASVAELQPLAGIGSVVVSTVKTTVFAMIILQKFLAIFPIRVIAIEGVDSQPVIGAAPEYLIQFIAGDKETPLRGKPIGGGEGQRLPL